MIASALSQLVGRCHGFPQGAVRARAVCVGKMTSESSMASTVARVMRKPADRPGGFGNSDRVLAGLGEARSTYHLNQRRVQPAASPLAR